MQIVMRKTEELVPYERNPRKNESAVDAVAESIRQFGFKVPIVLDKDNVIIAGHTRLKAAKKLGIEEVPTIVADDLSPEQIKAFRLADNKTAELAGWDFELLDKELAEIATIDMAAFGFEEEPESAEDVVEDDYETPDDEIPQRAEPGDLWTLGDHRLVCGDATDPDTIARVMDGQMADLLITDPPYNVSLGQEAGHALRPSEAKAMHRRTDGLTIANDYFENDEDFRRWLQSAWAASVRHLKPGAAFYIWHASQKTPSFWQACEDNGMKIRQILIWVKSVFALGRQDYQWQHEPCLYGWMPGAHYFTSARNESTVFDDAMDTSKMNKTELRQALEGILQGGIETTVLRHPKPSRSDLHPTTKPVKLFARLMANSTRPGEIVLDQFAGSGTTIIAAEQMGRKARAVELDGHYCDVIIDRWEKFTGQKARKAES